MQSAQIPQRERIKQLEAQVTELQASLTEVLTSEPYLLKKFAHVIAKHQLVLPKNLPEYEELNDERRRDMSEQRKNFVRQRAVNSHARVRSNDQSWIQIDDLNNNVAADQVIKNLNAAFDDYGNVKEELPAMEGKLKQKVEEKLATAISEKNYKNLSTLIQSYNANFSNLDKDLLKQAVELHTLQTQLLAQNVDSINNKSVHVFEEFLERIKNQFNPQDIDELRNSYITNRKLALMKILDDDQESTDTALAEYEYCLHQKIIQADDNELRPILERAKARKYRNSPLWKEAEVVIAQMKEKSTIEKWRKNNENNFSPAELKDIYERWCSRRYEFWVNAMREAMKLEDENKINALISEQKQRVNEGTFSANDTKASQALVKQASNFSENKKTAKTALVKAIEKADKKKLPMLIEQASPFTSLQPLIKQAEDILLIVGADKRNSSSNPIGKTRSGTNLFSMLLPSRSHSNSVDMGEDLAASKPPLHRLSSSLDSSKSNDLVGSPPNSVQILSTSPSLNIFSMSPPLQHQASSSSSISLSSSLPSSPPIPVVAEEPSSPVSSGSVIVSAPVSISPPKEVVAAPAPAPAPAVELSTSPPQQHAEERKVILGSANQQKLLEKLKTKVAQKKAEKQELQASLTVVKENLTKPSVEEVKSVTPEVKKEEVKKEEPIVEKGTVSKLAKTITSTPAAAPAPAVSKEREELSKLSKSGGSIKDRIGNMFNEIESKFDKFDELEKDISIKMSVADLRNVSQQHVKRQLVAYPQNLAILDQIKQVNDKIYKEQWKEAHSQLQALSSQYPDEDDINAFFINLNWCLLSNNHSIRVLEHNQALADQEAETALTYLGFVSDDKYEEHKQMFAFYMIQINALKVKVNGLVQKKDFKAACAKYEEVYKLTEKVKKLGADLLDTDFVINTAMCGIVYGIRGENYEVIDTSLKYLQPFIDNPPADAPANLKIVAAHGYKLLGVIELAKRKNEKKAQEFFQRALELRDSVANSN